MISGQLRYSIINPGPEITPLKFRGWFRQEAARIQEMAKGPHDIIVIRLFITQRLIAGVTQRKIDVALQDAVDRHPNIHRVELRPVEKPLTADEMMEAGREAQQDINEVAERLAETVEDENETPPTLH
ncbi:MAG: hypothetical protein H3C26_10735 [Rhodocyclaceae bacterium]|nr:hypothetical protein [Rhodocyclaceae bacterium]